MFTIFLKLLILLPIFLVPKANTEIKNCNKKSLNTGIEFKEKNKKITVLSTAEATYDFNDTESILDAFDEAKDQAILNIVEFLKMNIKDLSKNDKNQILLDDSKNKSLSKPISPKSDYAITSESVLKGLKLIDYCSFKKLKKIKATVEVSTKSVDEASKLKSIFNFDKKHQ